MAGSLLKREVTYLTAFRYLFPRGGMAAERGRELGVTIGNVGVSAHTKTVLHTLTPDTHLWELKPPHWQQIQS